jgi:hypothetical protein
VGGIKRERLSRREEGTYRYRENMEEMKIERYVIDKNRERERGGERERERD